LRESKLLAAFLFISLVAAPGSQDALLAAQDNRAGARLNDAFRTQVTAIFQSYRAGDTANGRKSLDQFRLPNPEAWFSEHVSPQQSTELAKRYDRLYANFADSFEHTVEDIVANRHAELMPTLETGRGETPNWSSPSAKLSGIVSVNPATLFFCTFQITVQKRNTTSWGDAFVYEDGAFRFVGFGAWPFWAWQDGTEGGAPKGGSFGTPAILIHRVDPVYPPGARSNNVEGVVVVHLFLDKQGSPKKADVVSGDPMLTQAALDSVRQWRYKPATLGGVAVESDPTVNVIFSLR